MRTRMDWQNLIEAAAWEYAMHGNSHKTDDQMNGLVQFVDYYREKVMNETWIL